MCSLFPWQHGISYLLYFVYKYIFFTYFQRESKLYRFSVFSILCVSLNKHKTLCKQKRKIFSILENINIPSQKSNLETSLLILSYIAARTSQDQTYFCVGGLWRMDDFCFLFLLRLVIFHIVHLKFTNDFRIYSIWDRRIDRIDT
jgi:hypothetical protein